MLDEVLITDDTLPGAYHKALWGLKHMGQIAPCADYNTLQKECSMTMVVRHPLQEPRISRLFVGGPYDLERYRREMLDGILDFEVDAGKWEYTYHARMANQIPFVIDELKRNPSSRRAVIDVRSPIDRISNEPACLQHLHFFIRNRELHLKVLFRSNDACKATFMNAFALICLQERIAKELGVEVGSYTHRANSFHCYEKDLPMLTHYCRRIADGNDLTYRYKGEWEELMADADEEIDEMVAKLRGDKDGEKESV